MPPPLVDLADSTFWLVFLAGVVVLVPLVRGGLRKAAFAATNLGFLFLLLSREQFLVVVAALVVVWLLLRLVGRPGKIAGILAGTLLAAGTLGLFVLHKLPWTAGAWGVGRANPLLAAVGFSYVALRIVEVFRAVGEGRHPAPGLLATINYVVPFHMLAAGPIQGYDEFVAQPPVPPPLSARDALEAAERIALGLVKKFVLAYVLQELFLTGFRAHGPYLLWEAQVFSIWLFLDFSGYSDVAVGAGRLLGVATPENFHRPYFARNLINYWERWHISLSMFIRRNLFIPVQLTLMRRTAGRHALWCASAAFGVAFVFCGLWHGMTVRFLLWGLLHAVGLIVVNLYRHWLTRRLGAQGVRQYLADWRIRAAAVLVTFEYVAFSLVVAFYPLEVLWP